MIFARGAHRISSQSQFRATLYIVQITYFGLKPIGKVQRVFEKSKCRLKLLHYINNIVKISKILINCMIFSANYTTIVSHSILGMWVLREGHREYHLRFHLEQRFVLSRSNTIFLNQSAILRGCLMKVSDDRSCHIISGIHCEILKIFIKYMIFPVFYMTE